MKKFIKKIFHIYSDSIFKTLYRNIKKKEIRLVFKRMYRNDMLRYLKHSRTLSNDNPDKMIGSIILHYHVIEKGLTMPEIKLGFGKERIISLCQACLDFINKYGQNDQQLNHAIGVVIEYERYHNINNFILDKEILESINKLRKGLKKEIEKTSQIQTTKEEYFKNVNSSFREFSDSRSSVRNYSEEELPLIKIQNALELARNTPSACNRQSWRTYLITDKQIIAKLLEAQGGNRGFGNLTNKLIVITGELGVFSYTNERNQVYIDGGMYAMNLLYALHSNEIATCILNCSFDYAKELEIKGILKIKDSEVLIVMISCGVAPHEFKIAASPRYNLDKTNTIIN